MQRFVKPTIAGILSLISATTVLGAPSAGDFAVTGRVELGGGGHWDYIALDAQRHRLYVTRGDHVEVLDTNTTQRVGNVANTPGVHGVAFAQDLKLGFTTNGKADSITAFDLDTLAVKHDIKVDGKNPDAVLYDAPTHTLYSVNGHSHDVSLIDAASGKTLRTIAVPGKPESIVLAGQRLYFNLEDQAKIAVVDLKAGKTVDTWKLPGCEGPTGLVFDSARARLFSACDNGTLVVTDAHDGHTVANMPIGKGPDAAAIDPQRGLVFTSNGDDGTLSVVHEDDANHFSTLATVPTAKHARTLVYDDATGTVYLPTPDDGNFKVVVVRTRAAS